jgi:polyisoprenoid-binding protein YceI
MSLRTLAVLAVLSVPAGASAQSAIYKIEPGQAQLTYKIVHKFHEVQGVSKQVQGAVALKPGEAQVQVRVDVTTFDSGNANRDSHMKETVEAAKYPFVTLKGVVKDFTPPTKFPATLKVNLDGQLEFHGVTHPLSVPVELTFADASHLRGKTEFDISLDAYKVERPSLMFIKINDACHITADLGFAK